MESKKINQLATELSPSLDDLTIIGDPTTGISRKITLSQMASLFTGTVEEYASLAAFPLVGTADTIYIALDTNVLYRWNGTAYVELSPNIVSSLEFNDANGFDGTINLVGSVATLTITTALTLGSLPFIGTSGALTQDNANLFYDDTNNRLGIGTNAPTTPLDVFGSGIISRINGTSTNNGFLGFASAGSNKWSVGNVQSDHRFRIFSEANTAELVSLLQTGEFGIGISNPTTKLHLDGGASALIANLDANVSVAKSISFRSDNSNRINLEVSGTESGSNAGANFFIRRYSDAGALIDTPLTITRSTGLITLATALSGTSATFANSINLSKASQSSAGFYIGDSLNTSSSSLFVKTGSFSSSFSSGFGVNGTYLGGLSTIKLHAIGTQTAGGYASSMIFVLDNDGVERNHALFSSDGSTTFSGILTASAFIPSGATIPTNGMYLSAANTLNFATNSTNRLSISSGGVSTFTTSNDAAIQIRSGNTSNFTYIGLGRNSQEATIGIPAADDQFMTGAAAGDITINNTSGKICLGTAAVARLTISAAGAATFSSNVSMGAAAGTLRIGTNAGDHTLLSYSGGATTLNTNWASTSALLRLQANGVGLTVNGNSEVFNAANTTTFNTTSDKRVKTNIVDLTDGLNKIMALRPTMFDYTDDFASKRKISKATNIPSFIADEYMEVFPDYVSESTEEEFGIEKLKSIDISPVLPYMVKAIQELKAQIEELKALIK
jgi:hypothetical protein